MGHCYLFLLVLEVPSSTLAQTVLLPFASVNSMGFGMACHKHSQQVITSTSEVAAAPDAPMGSLCLARQKPSEGSSSRFW
jgi:hypothetical protein